MAFSQHIRLPASWWYTTCYTLLCPSTTRIVLVTEINSLNPGVRVGFIVSFTSPWWMEERELCLSSIKWRGANDCHRKLCNKKHWWLSAVNCLIICTQLVLSRVKIFKSVKFSKALLDLISYTRCHECYFPHVMPVCENRRTEGMHPGHEKRHSGILSLKLSWPFSICSAAALVPCKSGLA